MIDKLIREIMNGKIAKDTLPESVLPFTGEAEAQYFSRLRRNLQSDMAHMVFTVGRNDDYAETLNKI